MEKLMAISLLFSLFIYSCSQKKDPAVEYQTKINNLLKYWNSGQFENIESTLHPEFEMRMSPKYETEKGVETFMKTVTETRIKYQDFKIEIIEGLYSDSAAAGRWTITATSQSGKKLEIMGISLLHFKDGMIKDEWISSNDLLWMEQLGYELKLVE